jgi:hypothetical protein
MGLSSEDRPGFQGELASIMMDGALPAVMILGELDAIRTASGAPYDAIGPTSRNHILPAIGRIFKVFNSFQEGSRFREPTITESDGVVKYILPMLLF